MHILEYNVVWDRFILWEMKHAYSPVLLFFIHIRCIVSKIKQQALWQKLKTFNK